MRWDVVAYTVRAGRLPIALRGRPARHSKEVQGCLLHDGMSGCNLCQRFSSIRSRKYGMKTRWTRKISGNDQMNRTSEIMRVAPC